MTAIFTQDTSYGGASDFDPVFSTSCSPPTSSPLTAYPTSSLRRQSSIALSAASKCMPLFQRAGSALAPRSKSAKVAMADLFNIPSPYETATHQAQDCRINRSASIKMASISETAAGWLGLSPTTTTQTKFTTRTSSRPSYKSESTIDEEELITPNISSHKSYHNANSNDPFASSDFLATLPSSNTELTNMLHDLHKAYLAKTAALTNSQTYIEELETKTRLQEQSMHELISEREEIKGRERGRATYMTIPPPLSPSLSMSSAASPATSSVFSSPVFFEANPVRRRERSPAMSDASSFPEEDGDVFTTILASTPGLSLWDENMMLKARVGELEEVVEGVLGLVN